MSGEAASIAPIATGTVTDLATHGASAAVCAAQSAAPVFRHRVRSKDRSRSVSSTAKCRRGEGRRRSVTTATSSPPSGRLHGQTSCDQKAAESQKRKVPADRLGRVDVVNSENLMIDDAFDNVEASPANQEQGSQARKRSAVPFLTRRWVNHVEPDNGGRPGESVKQPVGQRVCLESGDRRHRVFAGRRQHVMPLEDLVQDDSVNESSQADAEQQSADREALFWPFQGGLLVRVRSSQLQYPERPARNPEGFGSGQGLSQADDDSFGAAQIAELVGVLELHDLSDQLGFAVVLESSDGVFDVVHGEHHPSDPECV